MLGPALRLDTSIACQLCLTVLGIPSLKHTRSSVSLLVTWISVVLDSLARPLGSTLRGRIASFNLKWIIFTVTVLIGEYLSDDKTSRRLLSIRLIGRVNRHLLLWPPEKACRPIFFCRCSLAQTFFYSSSVLDEEPGSLINTIAKIKVTVCVVVQLTFLAQDIVSMTSELLFQLAPSFGCSIYVWDAIADLSSQVRTTFVFHRLNYDAPLYVFARGVKSPTDWLNLFADASKPFTYFCRSYWGHTAFSPSLTSPYKDQVFQYFRASDCSIRGSASVHCVHLNWDCKERGLFYKIFQWRTSLQRCSEKHLQPPAVNRFVPIFAPCGVFGRTIVIEL